MTRGLRDPLALLLLGVLALCLAAGLYARFLGLGDRPLAVDEYFFLSSIERVLAGGLPTLPGGGYYVHGLLAQYATAASILLLGDDGFAWRLPSVLSSLGSAALVVVYARPALGRLPAAAVGAALLVSSWEIEFARFARMYAPFQCATLLYLLAVDRTLLGPRFAWRYAAPAAGLLLLSLHEMGVILLPLLFAPFLAGRGRFATRGAALRYGLASTAVLCAGVLYTQTDFRNWGVTERFAPGYAPLSGSSLRTPELPFWAGGGEPATNLLLLLAVLGGAALAGAVWTARRGRLAPEPVWGGVLLGAAALHHFVVAGACAAVLVGRYDAQRRPGGRRLLLVAAAIGAAWLARALVSPDWTASVLGQPQTFAGALRRAFFGWPDFFAPLFVPWQRELPWIGAAIAGSLAWQLWKERKAPLLALLRNPAAPVLYVCLVLAVLRSTFATGTRYAYFVYPVALCAVALTVSDVARRRIGARAPAIAALAGLALFALSGDFDPRHIAAVESAEVTYRTGRYERFAETWYPRWDYAGAAGFVEREGAGAVVVVDGLPPVSHYLALDHAVFYGRADPRLRQVSRDRGTRELWSGRRLLSTDAELRAFAETAPALWIVRAVAEGRRGFRAEQVLGDRLRGARRAFQSADGRIEVVELSLVPAPGAPTRSR